MQLSSHDHPAPKDVGRFLLVTRIGRRSLHNEWLGGKRDFDVFFSCYDPSVAPINAPGVSFEYRPGYKAAGYDGILRDPSSGWQQYDYICLMDEDLRTDTETLNRMFRLCSAHQLKIAQPSLSFDSYFTYGGLLQQRKWQLRFVNFIEMMCPVFSCDALKVVAPLYSLGYESGIDLIWCNLVNETPQDFAVLDSCPVTHTEPVGQRKSENGFVDGRDYKSDIYSILTRFGIPRLSCIPYAAVTHSGKIVSSRFWLSLATFGLLRAVPVRQGFWSRLRSVLDHIRHVIFRPPNNVRVQYPTETIEQLQCCDGKNITNSASSR